MTIERGVRFKRELWQTEVLDCNEFSRARLTVED